MPDKSFEHTIRFYQPPGQAAWIPLVTVNLVQANGNRVSLPLIFDTGASVTTLRHDLYPLLGVPSWDSGEPQETQTAGGPDLVRIYRYQATLEFLGKTAQCPIDLAVLPQNPFYLGLFGREQIFDNFGFGFWESTHELYVTVNP